MGGVKEDMDKAGSHEPMNAQFLASWLPAAK
jgi:hypothetical protein